MLRNILLVLSLVFTASAHGDINIYTFTGEIPDGASEHPMIADGETWTAIMGLDIDTKDDNFADEFGVYSNSVRFGQLIFSGGYETHLDLSVGDAFILDNVGSSDSVRVRGDGFTFQVNNEDLTTFSGDSFLDVGTVIEPFDNPAQLEFFQLTLVDDLGSVIYLANQANNVSLTVSAAVPEPGATALILAFAFGSFGSRRRSS